MADGKEEEDEMLDFTSSKFNPLKALYSRNVRLPIENAPVLDNIHKYRSSLNPREKKKKVCSRLQYSLEVITGKQVI
jgi:hypothetical protein